MNNLHKILEENIDLSNEQIHVFLLDINLINYKTLLPYLSEEEQIRADKLKAELKKNQFIIARGLLRKLLSNSLGKPVDEIKISYGQHKKPYIEEQYNDYSVDFNISHSGEFILLAITLNSQIGVDIEKINHELEYLSLSNRFFSESEKKELLSFKQDEQLDAFYRAWVRKESFIKATGKGIAFGLDRFSVSLSNKEKSLVEHTVTDTLNEDWYCYDLMNICNYKTALASSGKERNIIFFQ